MRNTRAKRTDSQESLEQFSTFSNMQVLERTTVLDAIERALDAKKARGNTQKWKDLVEKVKRREACLVTEDDPNDYGQIGEEGPLSHDDFIDQLLLEFSRGKHDGDASSTKVYAAICDEAKVAPGEKNARGGFLITEQPAKLALLLQLVLNNRANSKSNSATSLDEEKKGQISRIVALQKATEALRNAKRATPTEQSKLLLKYDKDSAFTSTDIYSPETLRSFTSSLSLARLASSTNSAATSSTEAASLEMLQAALTRLSAHEGTVNQFWAKQLRAMKIANIEPLANSLDASNIDFSAQLTESLLKDRSSTPAIIRLLRSFDFANFSQPTLEYLYNLSLGEQVTIIVKLFYTQASLALKTDEVMREVTRAFNEERANLQMQLSEQAVKEAPSKAEELKHLETNLDLIKPEDPEGLAQAAANLRTYQDKLEAIENWLKQFPEEVLSVNVNDSNAQERVKNIKCLVKAMKEKIQGSIRDVEKASNSARDGAMALSAAGALKPATPIGAAETLLGEAGFNGSRSFRQALSSVYAKSENNPALQNELNAFVSLLAAQLKAHPSKFTMPQLDESAEPKALKALIKALNKEIAATTSLRRLAVARKLYDHVEKLRQKANDPLAQSKAKKLSEKLNALFPPSQNNAVAQNSAGLFNSMVKALESVVIREASTKDGADVTLLCPRIGIKRSVNTLFGTRIFGSETNDLAKEFDATAPAA